MNIPAGRALDRLLGEALGYWVYHYDKGHPANCYYELMEPEGLSPVRSVPWGAGERKTEAEAWEDLPHFSTKLVDAWSLAERFGLALVPQSVANGFRWLACDLVRVRYGAHITVEPIDTTLHSADDAAHALALSALATIHRQQTEASP